MKFVLGMAVRETRASFQRLIFFFVCIAVGETGRKQKPQRVQFPLESLVGLRRDPHSWRSGHISSLHRHEIPCKP